jgi:PAS domain S-box-containing protein
MKDFVDKLSVSTGFTPHGDSYLWKPGILWTQVVSDALIASVYFIIPLCLLFIARQRTDFRYRKLLVLFCIFMYSCGITHMMSIITVWSPLYQVEGILKALTAIVSVSTAFLLIRITPKALTIPTKEQWDKVNLELAAHEKQLAQKDQAILQSTRALKESEERYNTLRELFDSVIIYREDKIVYTNPSTLQLLGASDASQLLGKSIAEFVPDADKATIVSKLHLLTKGEKVPLFEQQFLRLDGQLAVTELLLVPFFYEGQPAVQMIIRDISSRKSADKLLRESEAKFRGLFESNMIGTMFWELDGKVSDANDALLDMIGYTREELETGNINWLALTPAAFANKDSLAYQQISTSGNHQPYEKEYIRKDGSRVPILVGGSLLKGFTNKGVSYVVDITEQKKQQQILQESEAKFRHIFELDILGVLFADENNKITEANNAFLKMVGYSRQDLENGLLQWPELTPPEYKQADAKAINALMQHGVVQPYEKEYYCKDGSRVSVLVGAAILKDTGSVVAFILNITEQKKQEEQLRQSEAKFRRLFESDLIGIKFSDAKGSILDANDSFLQMLGYSREELQMGKIDWITITPPEYAHLDQRAAEELKTSGEVKPFEKEYIRKDGSRVPVIIGMAMLKDLQQGVSFMLDISERKVWEKQLRDSEARFRGVFESDMMGILFTDYSGKILNANNAFLTTLQYTKQELENNLLSWRNMTPPEYEVLDAKGWSEIMNIGLMTPYEKEYIRKDGKRVPVLVGASLLSGFHDTAVAFVLDITQEITFRHELKQQAIELQQVNAELEESQEVLRLSEARFRRMFEMDLIGIVFWDKQGNFLDVNDLFLEIVGYTREDWANGGINWIALTPPEYRAKDAEKIAEMDETGIFTPYEKEYYRKDGSRVPILLAGAVLDGFTDRGVSYVLDITNLKKVQQELEQRARELARSNEELEQFAYIASHDLQEPIRTMAGFANLLEKKYKDKLDTDAHDFIGFIVDAADRMKKLITTLLEYSRVNTRGTAFTEVDVEKILLRVSAILQPKIQEAKATLTWDPMPTIYADGNQLSQVFEHLLNNAIKFRDQRPLTIHIQVENQPAFWQFAVQDTGIGIDMAYAQRIFQVFQRLHTRDKYEGTGIGLAICKRILDRHNGHIWVDSILGKGSVFYFTIAKPAF